MRLSRKTGLSLAAALAFSVLFAPSGLAAPSSAHAVLGNGGVPLRAAPAAQHPPYTHTTVTKIQLSKDVCAKRKVIPADRTNDPTICTVTLTERSTDFIPSVATGATPHTAMPAVCPSGDRYFDDVYWDPLSFDVEMTSHFYWLGDCASQPHIYEPQCWINVIAGPVSQETCWSYNPDWRSTAAKHYIVWQPYGLFFSVSIWQRRQCYDNMACDYHTDAG